MNRNSTVERTRKAPSNHARPKLPAGPVGQQSEGRARDKITIGGIRMANNSSSLPYAFVSTIGNLNFNRQPDLNALRRNVPPRGSCRYVPRRRISRVGTSVFPPFESIKNNRFLSSFASINIDFFKFEFSCRRNRV